MIKASAAGEIRQLIAALAGGDDVRREAAVARLAILGGRAVDRLLAAYAESTDRVARTAILRALEPSADTRTVPVAKDALADGGDLAVAASGVLRGLLNSPHAGTATTALDALVAAAMDPAAPHRIRLAALDALDTAPGDVRERVADALRHDPDATLRARAVNPPNAAATADAMWQDAIEDRLPDDPEPLRECIRSRAPAAALSTLQKLVDVLRNREAATTDGTLRQQWCAVRGTLHQALALRGSTVAVYDLREALEGARGPLPVSFLAAVHVIGDESCLEALAAAYARGEDQQWKRQVRDAFRAIVRREKLTRRTAAMKRVLSKYPAEARELTASA